MTSRAHPPVSDLGRGFADLVRRFGEGGVGSPPAVMGVVNVTPDSFSDGGLFYPAAAAIEHGRRLAREGAAILDIGGESTRKGATPVSEAEELRRVIPVIEALREAGFGRETSTPELHVVCDVRVPFEDAPRVYGPQKGADPAMVKRLEKRLDELAASFPRDPRGEPMTGAAGGLSGGLWAAHGAKLMPGASYVLDAIGFDARMRASAFVVTEEGSLDAQTLQGKIVGEVATRCRQGGVTCHAIVGQNQLDPFGERIIDLASVTEATTLGELKHAGRGLVGELPH